MRTLRAVGAICAAAPLFVARAFDATHCDVTTRCNGWHTVTNAVLLATVGLFALWLIPYSDDWEAS
jgi:hypothetical protein